jgi:hypothetical protein
LHWQVFFFKPKLFSFEVQLLAEFNVQGVCSLPKRQAFGTELFVQIPDFLEPDLAEEAYRELRLEAPFTKTPGLGFLELNPNSKLPRHLQICSDILTGPDFLEWLSDWAGEEVRPQKSPAFFRMEDGDRIDVHDDISHAPLSRLSGVLHLSKDWKREYGGNTVVGATKKKHTVDTEYGPMTEWIFGSKRSVLVPKFNCMTVLRLRSGLAHGVTQVVGPRPRLSIVEHYEALPAK